MKHISLSLISIYSLNIAYKFYCANNLNLNELFENCDFNLDKMKCEGTQIPVKTFLKSVTLIKKNLSDKQSLALILGEYIEISDFGTYGFTLLSAPTLNEGLLFMIEGFAYMDSTFELEWIDDGLYSIQINIKNSGQFEEFNEDILDLALLTLQKYISHFFDYSDVSANSHKTFNAKKTNIRSLSIHKEQLKLVSKMSHIAFFNDNKKRILKEVSSFKKMNNCVFNVNRIIKNELLRGEKPNLNQISSLLGVTAKTLSRTLKVHNTNFQTCLDQVICDMAIKLLEDKHNTKEIAYLLGFQSIAGLNYLFIKKYGLTLNRLKDSLNLSHQHTSGSP